MKISTLLLGMIAGSCLSATAQVHQQNTNSTPINDSISLVKIESPSQGNQVINTEETAEALKAVAAYEEEILKAEKARIKAEEKLAKEQAKAAKNAKKKAEREAKEAKDRKSVV